MKPQDSSLEGIRRFLMEDPPPSARPANGLPDLPRYEFGEKLGEGAMAVVHKAWDRQLDRPVAVKLIRHHASDSLRKRFEREVRTAAAITHPHVVKLYDSGEKDGLLYLVMELVEGGSLGNVLRVNNPDLDSRLNLFLQAARGTAALHERGITHRDLKPANILVAGNGTAKVGDFGLAHWVESETPLTRTGAKLGTPLYMAPEQARGQSRNVTPRTDVYSLGAILYELLTGRPPHIGDDLLDVFAKVAQDDIVPPRKIDPLIPPGLEAITLKALRMDPERRYPDAGALAEDLATYLEQGRARATVRHPLTGLRQKLRRNVRWIAAAIVMAAGVVVVGVMDSARRREEGRRQQEKAEQLARATLALSILSALNDLNTGTAENLRRLEDHANGARVDDVGRLLKQVEEVVDQVAARHPDTNLPLAWKGLARMYAARGSPPKEMDEPGKGAGEDPFPALLLGRAWLAQYVGAAQLPPSRRHGNRVTVASWPEDRRMTEARETAQRLLLAAMAKTTWPHLENPGRQFMEFARAANDFSAGQWEQAAARLESLQSHPILGGDAANLRAFSLRRLGRHEEAARTWETLSRRGWSIAGHRAGVSFLDAALTERGASRRLLEQAIESFKGSIARDSGPMAASTFCHWGLALVDLGKLQEARGEDPLPTFRLAIEKCDEGMRRDAEAARGYQVRALARLGAAGRLGLTDAAALEFEAAVLDAKAAVQREPGDAGPGLNLSMILTHRGAFEHRRNADAFPYFESAKVVVDELATTFPTDGAVFRQRGNLDLEWAAVTAERGRDPLPHLEAALRELSEAIRIDPDWDAGYADRANVHRVKADYLLHLKEDPSAVVDLALQDLDRVVSRNPEDASARFRRGYLHRIRCFWSLSQGREYSAEFESAAADLGEAIRLAPGRALYHEARGLLYEVRASQLKSRGIDPRPDMVRARDDYQRVIDLDPGHPKRVPYKKFIDMVGPPEAAK